MNTTTYSKKRFSTTKEWSEDKFNLKKVESLIYKYAFYGTYKKLLDVGCADGSFGNRLYMQFNYTIYGVDICQESITKAIENGIFPLVCDLEKKLPYVDNSFNVVIMCEVLEHIFDTDNILQEIYRVLKPGGYLFLTVPNCVSFTSRIKSLFGGYPNGLEYNINEKSNGHIRAYTPKILKRQLKDNNFNVIKMTSPNLLFPIKNQKIPMAIRELTIPLSDLTANLGEQIVTVARK